MRALYSSILMVCLVTSVCMHIVQTNTGISIESFMNLTHTLISLNYNIGNPALSSNNPALSQNKVGLFCGGNYFKKNMKNNCQNICIFQIFFVSLYHQK